MIAMMVLLVQAAPAHGSSKRDSSQIAAKLYETRGDIAVSQRDVAELHDLIIQELKQRGVPNIEQSAKALQQKRDVVQQLDDDNYDLPNEVDAMTASGTVLADKLRNTINDLVQTLS